MSTKKRARPSPAADAAQPEIDDAALRKALGDQKRAKSKAPKYEESQKRGECGGVFCGQKTGLDIRTPPE